MAINIEVMKSIYLKFVDHHLINGNSEVSNRHNPNSNQNLLTERLANEKRNGSAEDAIFFNRSTSIFKDDTKLIERNI